MLNALSVESDILIHELDRSNYLIYGNQSTIQSAELMHFSHVSVVYIRMASTYPL